MDVVDRVCEACGQRIMKAKHARPLPASLELFRRTTPTLAAIAPKAIPHILKSVCALVLATVSDAQTA